MEKSNIRQERRRDLRIDMSEPLIIKFQIQKSKGAWDVSRKKNAFVKNMSVGGMFLELPPLKQKQVQRIIEGKDRLLLELKTSQTRKPIRIISRIIRIERAGKVHEPVYAAGLSFEDIKEKDREEILHQLISICLKGGARIKYSNP